MILILFIVSPIGYGVVDFPHLKPKRPEEPTVFHRMGKTLPVVAMNVAAALQYVGHFFLIGLGGHSGGIAACGVA
jgi:hypothetical protein